MVELFSTTTDYLTFTIGLYSQRREEKMKHRHQLKLTNPKQTYLALQALEFSKDNVVTETPVIYFMQVDAVRLFYYLDNRLNAKVSSYARKKLYSDQELLNAQVRKFLIDDILTWTWVVANVPVEIEKSGFTPVLALSCGESSHAVLCELRTLALRDASARTKMLLTAMAHNLRHHGRSSWALRRDVDEMLEGV